METDTLGNGEGNEATENLSESVETEPNTDSGTLLFLSVPLVTDQ